MNVYAFISATQEDLGKDCRPAAIKAVEMCKAVPVCMEIWDNDYNKVADTCCQKIKFESSHFIGIFAYYYGCPHPALGKSITEAEFDWAAASNLPMAIYIPNPTSEFASVLRKRAAKQKDCDRKAQNAFRNRIMTRGTAQLFADVIDLSCRVTRTVYRWKNGGILGEAAKAISSNSSNIANKPTVGKNEVIQIGRRNYCRQFTDTLELGLNNIGSFLVNGPDGFGHKELILRLRQEFEQGNRSQPKRIVVNMGVPWRKNNLKGLLDAIGYQLRTDWVPSSPIMLADQLEEILQINDVILEIEDIQSYDGSIPSFAKEFWVPLASKLKNWPLRHQLVVLLTIKNVIQDNWKEYLQTPLLDAGGLGKMDPNRIIELTELGPFEKGEIEAWMRTVVKLPPQKAQILSETLVEKTQGNPESLYSILLGICNDIVELQEKNICEYK